MNKKVVAEPSISMIVKISLEYYSITRAIAVTLDQVAKMVITINTLNFIFRSSLIISSLVMKESKTRQVIFVKAQKISTILHLSIGIWMAAKLLKIDLLITYKSMQPEISIP